MRNKWNEKRNGKLADAIYGLAIGDALGVPYEFMSRGSFCCTGMTGYGTHSQPAGTWSDDTSMTIATVRSIIDTTGAVAGGLAGIVYGLKSVIAANCMDQLRGRAVIEECLWDEEEQVKHFHGKKCCTFSRKCSRTSFQIGLKLIKRYEGTETAWHADHIDRSLWQCTYCGAYFVLEETEQIAWGGGDDTYKDDYYQVDSEEHADQLVSRYGSLFAVYDGPMRAWG